MRFAYRYLIDRGIRGAFLVDGPFERRPGVGRVYRNPRLEPADFAPTLRVLSFDIETSLDGRSLYSIAAAGAGRRPGLDGPPGETGPCRPRRARDRRAGAERAGAARGASSPTSARPTRTSSRAGTSATSTCRSSSASRGAPRLRLTLGRTDEEAEVRRDRGFTREPARDPLRPPGARRPRAPPERLRPARRLPARDRGPGHPRQGQALRAPSTAARRSRPPIGTTPRGSPPTTSKTRGSSLEILERTGLVELTVRRSLLTGMQLDRVGAADRRRRLALPAPSSARAGAWRRRSTSQDAQGTVIAGGPRPRLASPASTGTSSSSTSRACTRA